jgi:hypothetical protein
VHQNAIGRYVPEVIGKYAIAFAVAGIFRARHYEKPSEKKTREKAEAIRRARKLARRPGKPKPLLSPVPAVPTAPVGRGELPRRRIKPCFHVALLAAISLSDRRNPHTCSELDCHEHATPPKF